MSTNVKKDTPEPKVRTPKDTKLQIRFTAILLICHSRFQNNPEVGKGKRRDAATLDFLVGAASAAIALGDKALYDYIAKVSALIITVRGYLEIEHMIEVRYREETKDFMEQALCLAELRQKQESGEE